MLSLVRSGLLRMIAFVVVSLPLCMLVAHVYTPYSFRSSRVLTVGFSVAEPVQSQSQPIPSKELPPMRSIPVSGTSVLGGPSLSADFVNQVLVSASSPAAGTGQGLYDLSVQSGIDDAYALAVFQKESSFGSSGAGFEDHALGNIVCAGYPTCNGRFRWYPSMIVSAGCNLGWVNRSGEMTSVVAMVGQFMPALLVTTFKVGLGLLFPLAVGAFALFDVTHLVEEILKSSHLDNRAVKVHRAEMHRTHYLAAQKKAGAKVRKEYDEICETDAQNMASRVRQGDLSFGADEIEPARSSVTRLQAPTSVRQLPPTQQALTGQFGPAPALPSGNTQNLVVPPPPVQTQGQSWFSRIANFGGQ
jgi:hypothetical protein